MITIHGLPKRLALGTVAAALVMMQVLPVPFAGLSGAALARMKAAGKTKAKRGAARAKARAANPSRRRFPLP